MPDHKTYNAHVALRLRPRGRLTWHVSPARTQALGKVAPNLKCTLQYRNG